MPARQVPENTAGETARRRATAIRKTIAGSQSRAGPPAAASQSNNFETGCQVGMMAEEQQRTSSVASHRQPQEEDAAMRDSELPEGCFEGVPVAQGRPVMWVPDGGIELALMRAIKGDNYCFLRYMLVSGWVPRNPNACNFSITIECNSPQEMEYLHVKDATPLHYAICCGSLKAVAVLIIAFPELVDLSCTIESSSEARDTVRSQWSTLDLVSFFSNLYVNKEQSRHQAYSNLCVLILALQQTRHILPFVNLPSTRERLLAAGKDANEVIDAFVRALQ